MPEATRSDWKTKEMPEKNEPFPLEMDLTAGEFSLLRQGHIPQEMEDKWFLFFEEGVLYVCRSWTGFCIYQIPVSPDGKIRGGTVNRDPEQYGETDPCRDGIMAEYLVSCQVERPQTRDLIMEYIKWGKTK